MATGRKALSHRERLSEEARKGCDSPINPTKGIEIDRNDLSPRKRSNKMLILRDYVVSAASQINAGAGSNGDNPTNLGITDFSLVATTLDKLCVEYKPLIIDLEFLAA